MELGGHTRFAAFCVTSHVFVLFLPLCSLWALVRERAGEYSP
jgi:hypothetical protein